MSVSCLKMEVSEVTSTTASASSETNESNKWPAGLSRAGAVAMSAISSLFAWLAAGTLRRCGAMDEEEVLRGLLLGLSPLICACLFSWTVALSAAPRAKRAGAVFARAACLLLLGAAADKLIAPIASAAFNVLVPLYSACACGRALAERRQRAGTERWSAATVASTPTYQSRADEQEERRSKATAVSAIVIMGIVLAASPLFMYWVAQEAKWEAPSTEDAFFLVFFHAGPLLLGVRMMLPCMVGCPVLNNISDMRFLAAMIGVIGWIVVVISVGVRFGMIAGAVVFWIGELGILGLLGYYLAVEAHYKQLMLIERRKPRRAKNASGLLDGRDSWDACSAHIDAAAGLCVDCVLPRRCKRTCRSLC